MLRFITVGRAVFTEFVEAALLKMILFQLLQILIANTFLRVHNIYMI